MDVHILRATKTDIPEMNVLVNRAYRGESSKKGWTTEADLLDGIRTDERRLSELIDDPSITMLKYLEDEKRIVGIVMLNNRDHYLYLGMLTVDPVIQSKGVGKKLLTAAEDVAKQMGLASIRMTVITVRGELIAWYERHGYTDTGEREPFPMENPEFGLPKQFLEFMVLEKKLG